jgi:hypothetical protein
MDLAEFGVHFNRLFNRHNRGIFDMMCICMPILSIGTTFLGMAVASDNGRSTTGVSLLQAVTRNPKTIMSISQILSGFFLLISVSHFDLPTQLSPIQISFRFSRNCQEKGKIWGYFSGEATKVPPHSLSAMDIPREPFSLKLDNGMMGCPPNFIDLVHSTTVQTSLAQRTPSSRSTVN